MVNPINGEKRDAPEYSLDAIRRLAESGHVEYRGKKIRRDVAELRFNLDDVLDCLQKLQSHHFAHSIWYESFSLWHDVYKPRYRARDSRTIDLYIKLRLNRNCVVIQLCSFHD